MQRRHFLKSGSLLPLAPLAIHSSPEKKLDLISLRPDIKLSVSSYSYWHFKGDKYPIEKVIDQAAMLGLDGIDVLHRQMESEEKTYINRLKRHAFVNGIAMTCLSIHQGFVTPDQAELKKHIDHTIHCMQLAADMDSINQCMRTAEDLGVLLALENHWGLGSTPEGMLRIMKAVDSPWLQLLMDTGNFLENPYSKLEKIAPYTCFVQAKTYYGGGVWYSLELDYDRIISILNNVGYKGYISIEFEGNEAADTGVKKSVELLRKVLGK